MAELAENIELMKIPTNQIKIDYSSFLSEISKIKCKEIIDDTLKNNKYIPQEILNYEELTKII